ncbi:hypothetical protein BCEP4_2990003 [Burkholderia cepacia]|nr:hypothetical protein BCEP4_2990003 [Burkholderia cepacia]
MADPGYPVAIGHGGFRDLDERYGAGFVCFGGGLRCGYRQQSGRQSRQAENDRSNTVIHSAMSL